MALNAARAGEARGVSWIGEVHPYSFEKTALPVANRKGMGVIAMKVFAQEKLNGKASPEQLIRYSLSLPVSAAVVGMPQLEHIDQNIAIAKAFEALPREEMQRLGDELSGTQKAGIDRFFSDHVDC
jgi:aryl-alcohol dehydrogenase-like predicted oxidoreductase